MDDNIIEKDKILVKEKNKIKPEEDEIQIKKIFHKMAEERIEGKYLNIK